jgi:SAM-dependent methyltransferase
MNKIQKKAILEYYTKLVEKHGYDPRSVGWGSKKGKQSIRYHILTEIGDLTNSTVLDIGCGFGDFYGYLKYQKKNIQYFGIDINPKLIEIAKKVYPNANFQVRDFQEEIFKRKFDWVFFSGISTSQTCCSYRLISDVMKEMFRICKKGLAMNFVGGVLDYKTNNIFYSEPEKIYEITRSISNRVVIRHDYFPYEFTVYVYKNNKKTSNHVFQDYLKTSKIKFDDSLWKPKNYTNKIKF